MLSTAAMSAPPWPPSPRSASASAHTAAAVVAPRAYSVSPAASSPHRSALDTSSRGRHRSSGDIPKPPLQPQPQLVAPPHQRHAAQPSPIAAHISPASSAASSSSASPQLHSLSLPPSSSDPSSPLSSSDAYGSSLYKTELCRSWSESLQCRYGSKCRFAHGLSELRAVARHRKYKTEQCVNFARDGACPYGPRCRFIHNLSTLDADSLPGLGPVSGLQHAILSDPDLPPFLSHTQLNHHSPQHNPTPHSRASSATHTGQAAAGSTPSLHGSSRQADASLPSSRAPRAATNHFPQSAARLVPPLAHKSTPPQHGQQQPLFASFAGRHRSESSASSAASLSPTLSTPIHASAAASAASSPAPSTVYSPFSAASSARFSPIDRPAPSPLSALSFSSSSRPSSAEEHDAIAPAASNRQQSTAPQPAQRHSHPTQRQSVRERQQQRQGYWPDVQRVQHEAERAQHSHSLGEKDASLDGADRRSFALLSVSGLVDDDDDGDSALPSRSLIASQQHSAHAHSNAQRAADGIRGEEPRSPPMTALHALHSQSLNHSFFSSARDGEAGKPPLDDEKQSVSSLSASSHSSLALRTAPAPFAVVSPPPLSAYPPQWSNRAASFSAAGHPSSAVSTSRSSSFAAANSPFLSHSPFSTSPFLPFGASPLPLPATPFELPRAALPPNSPALSSASSRSSASSASTATRHSCAGGGRPHAGSLDLQLLDEAEEALAHDTSRCAPASHIASGVACASGHQPHAARHAVASPGRSSAHSHPLSSPSSHGGSPSSCVSPSSPWLAPSLHIIDDAPSAPSRLAAHFACQPPPLG